MWNIMTSNLEFDDLPVGSRVKVVSEKIGSHFWYGDKGIVESNSGKPRGVRVRLDNPTILGNDTIKVYGFDPENLELTIDETATIDELTAYLATRKRVEKRSGKVAHRTGGRNGNSQAPVDIVS